MASRELRVAITGDARGLREAMRDGERPYWARVILPRLRGLVRRIERAT
jgi:hypothetical protein